MRGTAGDLFRVTVDNELSASTSVHWHGIRLHHAADGVPGVSQEPIEPGQRFVYEFVAPDPGTYFFHPHSGVQLDRALYAPLIIDDPAEPGRYDHEWVIVLDDWTDGVGRNPDDIFDELAAQDGPVSRGMGMGGHDMGACMAAHRHWETQAISTIRTISSTVVSPRRRSPSRASRETGRGCGSSLRDPTRFSGWLSEATQ